ncbi:hypothetical protein V5735_15115 (plasmid) [Haladaptatus sp. SPP-AMP-3]|uniref:hypothetical protein n=1 Tax=Haladaptatus sp. SPP-AMP-3 TaxID=3121295 RepID=UPI003C2F2EBC
METKTVRGAGLLVRAAQTLVAYVLFRLTVPFAGDAVYGTLSALGLDVFVTGSLRFLPILPVLVISVGVPFCCFTCWYYRRS